MSPKFIFSALLLLSSTALAYNNGAGAKPPMGWNTWCTYDVCGLLDKCTDAEVRQQAKAIVDEGLHELGYQYVNMDDCWSAATRDENGNLQADTLRFPYGMKALADYVHSLGLKIGVYTCIGTKTCKHGLPGSYNHYAEDAKTLASWGIDFVKTDNCHKPSGFSEQELYANFSKELNSTGHEMLFSLCEWGVDDVQDWGAKVGQMYRIQMDHLPLWEFGPYAAGKGFGQGTLNIIEYIATLKPSTFVKQYGWMDPDFLMTMFEPTMSEVFSRTEFTFWSLWSAPLLVATRISNMSETKASILKNEEVIAINQDDANTAGDQLFVNEDGTQVWNKTLANGDVCVVFFNAHGATNMNITVNWADVGFGSGAAVVSSRDLWQKQDMGNSTGSLTVSVAPSEAVMIRSKCVDKCSGESIYEEELFLM